MKTFVRKMNEVIVIDLEGKFYGGYDFIVLPRIQKLLESGERKFLFNMAKVSRIDSAGIGEVFACYKEVRKMGGDLKVCRITIPYAPLRESLSRVLSIFEDENEAVKSF